MNKFFLLFLGVLVQTAAISQSYLRCGSTELINIKEGQLPGFKSHLAEQFNQTKLAAQQSRNQAATIYVPVVVHVVYNTAQQNLDDSIIKNQIAILNRDFNRNNADASNLRAVFGDVGGSSDIVFYLADTDPAGNPTNGIIHKSTGKSSFSIDILGGSYVDLEKVKSAADGSVGWPSNKYCNIWVCNMAVNLFGTIQEGSLLGLATPPTNPLPSIWPSGATSGLLDGLVLYYKVVGDNNPTLATDATLLPVANKGRTAVHEMGHYLGLRHIWADKGNPLTGAAACTPFEDDGMADTPYMGSNSQTDGCNPSKNTCTYETPDLPDMIENYMDYSTESCQNTFTIEQVAFMRAILENQRIDLTNWDPTPTVGIMLDVIALEQMVVYPNPARHKLNLLKPCSETGFYQLYNHLGVEVEQCSFTQLESIAIGHLSAGVYILKVNTNRTSTIGRFVKE